MNDKWIFGWLLFANSRLGMATIYRIWGYFQ